MNQLSLRRLVWIFVLLSSIVYLHVYAGDGQFLGGSMSCTLEKQPDGNFLVFIELISCWVLGKGPCGPACSKADIGRSTRKTRSSIMSLDPYYFGNFSLKYRSKDRQYLITDINTAVNKTYNEIVIHVDEHTKWEQESMRFSINLVKELKEITISFDGYSWYNLSMQSPGVDAPWHLQTSIASYIRSDTNTTNNSPIAFARPLYRVALGKDSKIHIPVTDADGDSIRCSQSRFTEAGKISEPPNIIVFANCTISINASKYVGYTDNSWIAMQVSVRDYNRREIVYGSHTTPADRFSLSLSTVRFTVQVLENITGPSFVKPTWESSHVFILYVGSTWATEIYAEATDNTEIDTITALGRLDERILLNQTQLDPKRPNIYFSKVSWNPTVADIGQHIVCFSVIDSTGVMSDELRCFVLNVLPDDFTRAPASVTSQIGDLALPSEIKCEIGKTCGISFQIVSKTGVFPTMSIGYTDTHLNLDAPLVKALGNSTTIYQGQVSANPDAVGNFTFCFQVILNSKTDDEICVNVTVLNELTNSTDNMCFSCEDLIDPSFCDTIERCHSNQTCFVESYTLGNGGIHYRSGCKDKQICNQHSVAFSGTTSCLQCCENSFCNSQGCGGLALPPRQSRGPLCLDCARVKDPVDCDQIAFCSSGESCSIEKLKWGDAYLYHLGCESTPHCSFETNSRASDVEFETRSIPVCRGCCHNDFCNRNCTTKHTDTQQIFVG